MRIYRLYNSYLCSIESKTYDKMIREELPLIWERHKPDALPIEIWEIVSKKWIKQLNPTYNNKKFKGSYDEELEEVFINKAEEAYYEAIEIADKLITDLYENWQGFWYQYQIDIENKYRGNVSQDTNEERDEKIFELGSY